MLPPRDQGQDTLTGLGFAPPTTIPAVLVWDAVNNQITGVVDFGTPGAVQETVSYSLNDSGTLGFDFKGNRILIVLANCLAGAVQGGMDVFFDNFFPQ